MGCADLSRRPLADKFLYVAIVPANAYRNTKFQLSTSISFGDMRGSQNKKWEPPSGQFLYRELVRINASKCAKFQVPSSISYGDIEGSQNKKWALLISPDIP